MLRNHPDGLSTCDLSHRDTRESEASNAGFVVWKRTGERPRLERGSARSALHVDTRFLRLVPVRDAKPERKTPLGHVDTIGVHDEAPPLARRLTAARGQPPLHGQLASTRSCGPPVSARYLQPPPHSRDGRPWSGAPSDLVAWSRPGWSRARPVCQRGRRARHRPGLRR